MKKVLFIFLVFSTLMFGASVQDCRNAVISRGYTITREHTANPDSGGEMAINFGAKKGDSLFSIYVEVSSTGRVIVFDVLKLM
ncbi:MAG: hypothetical protein ACRC0G_14985 [Fusobacteriaceae bacterium]